MATVQELLADARAQYHALQTGQAVVEVRDQNGETVRYNIANASRLLMYIQSLEAQQPGFVPPVTGPMRVRM